MTGRAAGNGAGSGWGRIALSVAISLGIFAVVLAVVEAVVVIFGIRSFVLPRPSAVFSTILSTPAAYRDAIVRTGIETLSGLVAGSLFGVFMGVAFSMRRLLREMVFPIFVVSQTIPVIAFGALVVMWFGNTIQAKAVIVFYLSFFPVTVNTLLGMKAVDARQVALMRSFGATEGDIMRKLRLPTALPHIFVSLRIAAALGLSGAVVGEWFGDTTGLGVLLLQGMYAENMAAIWASILCSAALGIALIATITGLERRIVFWGGEQA
ncbi:ABC transporter permease [Sinirhodobacter populi]|uniref:ABC transporter permease n=1 Tax=Paenirhodobacter populi TaxID=2306993 RepID=A0A443KAV4_9RHOB|nr:ABC transporter permease [Sinirhodobacter populi]RWR29890.1 ABC transporter permease [Sinirhodobacter populi]